MADEKPPKGIRAVRGRFVANARTGMPELEINRDDLVRAAWSLTMEKYFPEPKPPTRWERFKAWIRTTRE